MVIKILFSRITVFFSGCVQRGNFDGVGNNDRGLLLLSSCKYRYRLTIIKEYLK